MKLFGKSITSRDIGVFAGAISAIIVAIGVAALIAGVLTRYIIWSFNIGF